MKLTGRLKTQVESAATKEEKRDAIKKVMLLSDDELNQVSGGQDEIGLRLEKCSVCNMTGVHATTCTFYIRNKLF